jgi:hypothetical protein
MIEEKISEAYLNCLEEFLKVHVSSSSELASEVTLLLLVSTLFLLKDKSRKKFLKEVNLICKNITNEVFEDTDDLIEKVIQTIGEAYLEKQHISSIDFKA